MTDIIQRQKASRSRSNALDKGAATRETTYTAPDQCASVVFVVTVTYGKRAALLEPVLAALLQQDVAKIVVVNNGAKWNVSALARQLTPDKIEIVEFQANQGSAIGFAAGIERARKLGAEFIWLLDDDNQPTDNALSTLLGAYSRLSAEFSEDKLAVVAFRPDHQADVAAGVPLLRISPRPSSFWGFHIFDVPYKLWRRTPWGRPQGRETLQPLVEMAIAPYSGLLFHRAVVETHGLPLADFVLYGDDTEFTYRITRDGGAIYLVTSARLTDLETSWNVKRRFGNSFQGWLSGAGDMRAFYGARNGTYIDLHCRPHSRLMFAANRQVYCWALWLYAQALRRTGRYRLLRHAIRDGIAGHLGLHPRYPLP